MKILIYIQYFFYIAFNWNFRLAITVIYYEIKGETTYKINSSGYDELKSLTKKGIDISHATLYMPASYNMLEEIFKFLSTESTHHFLDIGCGKGRVLAVAAHYGFKKITGIDFSEKLTNVAKANMLSVKNDFQSLQYSVQTVDAADFAIPDDVDVIFLFNPFDEFVMKKVAENISKSILTHRRDIFLVYENPLYKNIFF